MKIELTNLKELKENLLSIPNLTKEDKRKLYEIWRDARNENRKNIIKPIEYWYGKTEERIVTLKGESKLTSPCPTTIKINGLEYFLYEDFELKIGNTLVTFLFKGVELMRIDIEDIVSFDFYL